MNRKLIFCACFMLIFSFCSSHVFAEMTSIKTDLTVRVIDKQQGLIEVRNISDIKSPPSTLYVNCTRRWQGEGEKCAAGLKLSHYIKKWNILSFQIPALEKNQHFNIKLFSEKNLPRKKGFYGMAIIIDPLKKIPEQNESNNFTRLDVTLENTITGKDGVLSMTFRDKSNSDFINRFYAISAYGHKKYIKKGTITHLNPVELDLKPGKYTLHIIHQWQQTKQHDGRKLTINPVLGAESIQTIKDIKITPGTKTIENIVFKPVETGTLHISAFLDGKPIKAFIRIFRESDKAFVFSSPSDDMGTTPLDLNLISDNYLLTINPKGSVSGSNFAGYPEKAFTPQTFQVTIKANQPVSRTAQFRHIKKSRLMLKVLLNGKPVKTKIQVKPPEKNKQYYSTVESQYKSSNNIFDLLPGQYDLLITPYTTHVELPAISTYHRAGISIGGIKYYPDKKKAITLPHINVESGKDIRRTLKINKP